MAKCLRCGAGAEWIQGRVRPEPADEPTDDPARRGEAQDEEARRSHRETKHGSAYAECDCPQPTAQEDLCWCNAPHRHAPNEPEFPEREPAAQEIGTRDAPWLQDAAQEAEREDAEHKAYLLGWRESLDAMEDHIKKQREFLARVWGPKWKK